MCGVCTLMRRRRDALFGIKARMDRHNPGRFAQGTGVNVMSVANWPGRPTQWPKYLLRGIADASDRDFKTSHSLGTGQSLLCVSGLRIRNAPMKNSTTTMKQDSWQQKPELQKRRRVSRQAELQTTSENQSVHCQRSSQPNSNLRTNQPFEARQIQNGSNEQQAFRVLNVLESPEQFRYQN